MIKYTTGHLYSITCTFLLTKRCRKIAWLVLCLKIIIYSAQLHLAPFLGFKNDKVISAAGESATNILMTIITGAILQLKLCQTKSKKMSSFLAAILFAKVQDNAFRVDIGIRGKIKNSYKALSSVFFLAFGKMVDEAVFVLIYVPIMRKEDFISMTLWASLVWPTEILSLSIIIWIGSKASKMSAKNMRSVQSLLMMILLSFMLLFPFCKAIVNTSYSSENIDEIVKKFMDKVPAKIFYCIKVVLEAILTAEVQHASIFLSSSLALAIEMGAFYTLTKYGNLVVESIPSFTYFLKHMLESVLMLAVLAFIIFRRIKKGYTNPELYNVGQDGCNDVNDGVAGEGYEMTVQTQDIEKGDATAIEDDFDGDGERGEDGQSHNEHLNVVNGEGELGGDCASNKDTKVEVYDEPKQPSAQAGEGGYTVKIFGAEEDKSGLHVDHVKAKKGEEQADVDQFTCGEPSKGFNHDSGASTGNSEELVDMDSVCKEANEEHDDVSECKEPNEEHDDEPDSIQYMDEEDVFISDSDININEFEVANNGDTDGADIVEDMEEIEQLIRDHDIPINEDEVRDAKDRGI